MIDEPALPQALPPRPRTAFLGLAVGLVAIVALFLAGAGTRWGLWDFRAGFTLLRWATYAGLAAVAASIVGWCIATYGHGDRRGRGPAALGLLLGLVVAAIPWNWRRIAREVPPIHDITTDTENPPAFRALLSRRADAPNSADYGGAEVARQQREAYPEIEPALLDMRPEEVYARALAAAKAMGWEIVAADSADGVIEATDRTRWFGFYDDVVVRVAPIPEGARVDVRSVSRVGQSDVGTNARRIRDFLRRLERT